MRSVCCRRRLGAAIAVILGVAGCTTSGSAQRPPVRALHAGSHCEPVPGLDDGGARGLDSTETGVRVRLSMGRRSSGGHAVELRQPEPVDVVSGVARVAVAWREPAQGSVVTTVMTRPCLEVSVPHAYRGIDFVDGHGRVRGSVRWREGG